MHQLRGHFWGQTWTMMRCAHVLTKTALQLPKVFNDLEFLGLAEQRVSTIKADAEPWRFVTPPLPPSAGLLSSAPARRDG